MRRAGGLVAGIGCLLVAAGCGSDEAPAPEASATIRPMRTAVAPAPKPEPAPEFSPEIERLLAGEPDAIAVEELERNRPPQVQGLQVQPAERIAGQDVRVRPQVADPEGDAVEIEYTWLVNGEEVEATGPVFETRSLRRGDTVQVRVVANDGRSDSNEVVSPLLVVENAAPVFTSEPAPPGPDGVFRYQVTAEDPDGDVILRYRLAEAPAGMKVTTIGGLVEWQPRADQLGVQRVEIVVEDSDGGTTHQRFELDITPPADPAPAAPAR